MLKGICHYTGRISSCILDNPHIFFLDTNGTYKDLLCTDTFKPRKNIAVFVSITDRKVASRVSRDAQNVCAVTIVGTALKWPTCYRLLLVHLLLFCCQESAFAIVPCCRNQVISSRFDLFSFFFFAFKHLFPFSIQE